MQNHFGGEIMEHQKPIKLEPISARAQTQTKERISERESYDIATFIKKTYQLFAASLMAATTGAYIGMQMAPAIATWYWGLVILEFAMLIGLIFTKRKPGLNLILLFGFTFTSGLTLTPLLAAVLAMPAGAQILTNALLLTGLAFGGISLFAINTKRDFSFMGRFLFISLLIMIGAALLNIFLHSSMLQTILAGAGAIIFSLFILFDTQNIIRGNYDSPVEAAVDLYLDVLNLFVSILQLLGILGNEE